MSLIYNRYKIIRSLGGGTYGNVHKAYDTILNQEVAIKIINNWKLPIDKNPEYIYYKKSKELLAIQNGDQCFKHLIIYYDGFMENDNIYIIMEYIKGSDLFDWYTSANKPIDVNMLMNIIKALLLGLEDLHNMGIVHRDLKLENILIGDNGSIKIIDFGLSGFKDLPQTCKKAAGTIHYVSPDIINNPLNYKVFLSNDIWSLGVIFYILMHNQYPFGGKTRRIIIKNINKYEPKFNYTNSSSQIYTNEWLNAFVNMLLVKESRLRPNIKQVIKNLSNYEIYHYKDKIYTRFSWLRFLRDHGHIITHKITKSELLALSIEDNL